MKLSIFINGRLRYMSNGVNIDDESKQCVGFDITEHFEDYNGPMEYEVFNNETNSFGHIITPTFNMKWEAYDKSVINFLTNSYTLLL